MRFSFILSLSLSLSLLPMAFTCFNVENATFLHGKRVMSHLHSHYLWLIENSCAHTILGERENFFFWTLLGKVFVHWAYRPEHSFSKYNMWFKTLKYIQSFCSVWRFCALQHCILLHRVLLFAIILKSARTIKICLCKREKREQKVKKKSWNFEYQYCNINLIESWTFLKPHFHIRYEEDYANEIIIILWC